MSKLLVSLFSVRGITNLVALAFLATLAAILVGVFTRTTPAVWGLNAVTFFMAALVLQICYALLLRARRRKDKPAPPTG